MLQCMHEFSFFSPGRKRAKQRTRGERALPLNNAKGVYIAKDQRGSAHCTPIATRKLRWANEGSLPLARSFYFRFKRDQSLPSPRQPADSLVELAQAMADSSSKISSRGTAECSSSSFPSSSSGQQLQSLAKEYATISKLMVQLDAQVKTMTQSVGTMVRSVPAHDGLSATLESLGDSAEADMSGGNGSSDRQCKKSRKNNDDEDDAVIMGDEASTEKDDPLIFL